MLDAADADSLVLLDELGRATDPEEGGALGIAVLERVRAAGAFTLASTHLLALKIRARDAPSRPQDAADLRQLMRACPEDDLALAKEADDIAVPEGEGRTPEVHARAIH